MSFLITMSQKELHRLELIQKIRDERLSVVQVAKRLDLSRSQVHRLLQAYDRDGPAGLVSKKRSRPSNRRHSEEFRNAALDLIRERYLDFGPTLAREKLIELHRISVAKETLRQWMTEAGIWVSRRERKKRVFQPRGRRDCFGELVQIDGSHHWWLSNRFRSVKRFGHSATLPACGTGNPAELIGWNLPSPAGSFRAIQCWEQGCLRGRQMSPHYGFRRWIFLMFEAQSQ